MERNIISEIQRKYEEAVKMITRVGENTKYKDKEKEIEKVFSEIKEIEGIKNRLEEVKKRISTMPEEAENKVQYEEQCEKQIINEKRGLKDKRFLLERLKEEVKKRISKTPEETGNKVQYEEQCEKQIINVKRGLEERRVLLERLKNEKDEMEKQKLREEENKRVEMFYDIRKLREITKSAVIKHREQIEGAMHKNEQSLAILTQKVIDIQKPEIIGSFTKQQFYELKKEYEKLLTEKVKLEKMLSMCDEYVKELDSDYYEMPEQLPVDKMYIHYMDKQERGEEEKSQPKGNDVLGVKKTEDRKLDSDYYEMPERGEEEKSQSECNHHVFEFKVSENKIYDNGIRSGRYSSEKRKGKQLKEQYNIKTLFHKDRKHEKRIDWALVWKLEKIDSTGNLVMDYLSIIKGEPLNGKSIEESRDNFNDNICILYEFYEKDKSLSALNFWNRKRASVAYELGIADLKGISGIRRSRKIKDKLAERRKAMKGYIRTNKNNFLEKRAMDLCRQEQQEFSESEVFETDIMLGEDD